MPPVDPYAPISRPVVDATAAADPSVTLMNAANAKRQRDMQAFQQEQELKAAQEERVKQSAALAQAHDTHLLAQDQNTADTRTMSNDLASWSQDPQNPQYRVAWDKAPAEVPQYVHRTYPGHEAEAATEWNRAVTANTGNVVGVPQAEAGQVVTSEVAPGLHVQSGKPIPEAKDPLQSWEKPSPELLNQADEAGVPIVDAATGRPRKQSEIRTDMQKWYAENGVLPPIQQKIVDRRNEGMTNSKEFKDATELNLAYANAKHLLANNPNDGQAQLALLENMARMQNPGVSVRQGMMQILSSHQGILGKLNYDYLMQHAHEGSFLTPQTIANVEKLIDNTYSAKSQEWERSVLPQFRAGMRPELQPYIKSPFQQQAQPAQTQPAQRSAPNASAPQVSSRADFDALPKGAHYIGKNGQEYIKP